MSGATTINHLLAHHLATAEEIPQQLDFILSILNQRPIQQLEIEAGVGNTVSKRSVYSSNLSSLVSNSKKLKLIKIYRWTSRILSLLKPINSAEVRQAGFVLLHQTLSASPSTLLLTAKEALSYALNILESPKDNALFLSALEAVRLILGESIWIGGEWSRDTVGAAMVQRTVKALVKVANGPLDEVSTIQY